MTQTTPAIPTDTLALHNGGAMPLVGFGTWQITGEAAVTATAAALEAGYRHLDTATVYGNEAEVGRALADSGVPRDDVFVTTKFPPSQAGQEREVLERSLEALRTDHLDLWLVHWVDDEVDKVATWERLVAARNDGLVRDIGVSNYDAALIDTLTSATGVTPAVNQIRWSPFLYDAAVVEAHRQRGVVLEGYSALRGGTLDDATIGAIAGRLDVTAAQVIVRWHVQHGTVVIPKSTHPERIRVNADVAGFELTAEDMAALDALEDPGA